MRKTLRPFLMYRRACLALGLAAMGFMAHAEPLSDRPVRIVVGAPAGGTADIIARLVGTAMSANLGQPVVVENKPGAGGAIAMDAMLSAPKDGHTYLLSVNALVTELSYTAGTLSHVLGLQLNQLSGLDMIHVGYKGSPPALQDVMGGSVQFMFDGLATSVPNIKGGKLRAFAVTSPQRSHALPDVPTMAELGFKDMTRTAWLGLWSVPGQPDAALKRIREEALKALATPAVRDRLMAVGLNVNTQNPPTPEQMAKSLLEDYESVGAMLKSVNYKPE